MPVEPWSRHRVTNTCHALQNGSDGPEPWQRPRCLLCTGLLEVQVTTGTDQCCLTPRWASVGPLTCSGLVRSRRRWLLTGGEGSQVGLSLQPVEPSAVFRGRVSELS